MNRVRKRFVTKPLALALSFVFLLTNAGGVTTLSSVLAAAASLGIIFANTTTAYATQLHLHANYTLATAVMAARVLPPAPDDAEAAGSGCRVDSGFRVMAIATDYLLRETATRSP